MTKYKLRFSLLIIVSIMCISLNAQDIDVNEKSQHGFYVGVDVVLAAMDNWKFTRNDLDLEQFSDNGFGSTFTFRPIIGYRFHDIYRVEASYWRKDYSQGLLLSPTSTVNRSIYDTHLITSRILVDKNLWRERLFVYPSIGLSYGHRIGLSYAESINTSQPSSSVGQYQSTTIYHRDNFAALELGLGAKVKIIDKLALSLQVFLNRGIDQVVTVRYDTSKPATNQFSTIESRGTNCSLVFGLTYDL